MTLESFAPHVERAQSDLRVGNALLSDSMNPSSNSVFKQMQDGAADSISDWQGHARRGAVTGTLSFMMSAAAERVPFPKLALPIMAVAVGVTALDNAIFKKDKAQKTDDTFVSNITEFGVDLASSAGLGLLMGRVGWGRAGQKYENHVVETMTDSQYHSARMGGRGPKRFPVRAHYTEHYIPVDTKMDRISYFLTSRNQMHRYDDVAKRVTGAHQEHWKDYEAQLARQFDDLTDSKKATNPLRSMLLRDLRRAE